jgi:hypothetical protein
MLLITSSLLCPATCLPVPCSNPTNDQESGPGTPPPRTVEITFDGLMVFHKSGNYYEVGIPDNAAIHETGHQFSIAVTPDPGTRPKLDKARLTYLKGLGNNWLLEVDGSSQGNRQGITEKEKGHDHKRLTDSEEGQWDFSWMMDLESREFHGHKLDLIPGNLRPIIHLSTGDLYTKYKSEKLRRQHGEKAQFTDFGFVTETVGLKIELQDGEYVVLRVSGEGEDGEAFRVNSGVVAIENSSNHLSAASTGPSHFQLYYGLFSDKTKRFDFALKKPPEGPLNPHATKKCCPYICGHIRLSKMDHPLW